MKNWFFYARTALEFLLSNEKEGLELFLND